MALVIALQVFRQSPPDLIEDQSNERLGPVDVGGRHDEVEGNRVSRSDQICDAPVAALCYLRNDRVAIETEKRHRGGQNTGAFVTGLVQKLARGAGDHGMWTRLAEMGSHHHRLQRRLDAALGVGQKIRDTGECLVLFGVENVQDRADQQRVTGLLPVIAFFQRALGIDQNVGDVLDIAHFPFATADFQQRIVGGRIRIRRIEQQRATMLGTEAGCELPVLTLDVVDDGRSRPGQQRRDDEANAFARSGRCETQHMLGSVMAEVSVVKPAEHHTVRV